MSKAKLNVLITRPQPQGEKLQLKLQNLNINAVCQPLFDYKSRATLQDLAKITQPLTQPLLIFISVAAVEFAEKIKPLSQWSYRKIIAVGDATQKALKERNIDSLCPEIHTSEGILKLIDGDKLSQQDVLIIRGDGGRELLAQTLSRKGAKVCYLEAYQRIWYKLDSRHVQQWHNQEINCIVVTSNALLESIVHLIKDQNKFWQKSCLWIVASQRIADSATSLGLNNVVNAHGASDSQVINAILKHGIE